jgi:glucokinase
MKIAVTFTKKAPGPEEYSSQGYHLTIESEPPAEARLLRAVDRTRGVLGLRRVLSALGLSASRFHAWQRAAQRCGLEDQPSCPRSSPQRITPAESRGDERHATTRP